jgi:hypothetical protein
MGEWTYSLFDCKNEFWAKYPDNILDRFIVNRFLTTGTVSKGKCQDGHQYLMKLSKI